MGGQGKAPFRFNQFGGTFGGPVVLPHLYKGRDKTFFFGSMELVRFAQGVVFTGTMPTAQQLAGDFSATRNAAGSVIAVYDPFSTRPSGTAFVRSPFPGNIIPQDRINPISRNIAKYFPAPNAPGNPVTGVNNYFRNGANQIEKNTFSARVDHYFNESNRFFTRFNFDNSPNNRAKTYGDDSIATPTAGPQVFARRNAVIEDTQTFTPTLLGVFRYSYTRLGNQRKPYSDGFDITTLGFPAGLSNAIGARYPCRHGAGGQDLQPARRQDGPGIPTHPRQHAAAWRQRHEFLVREYLDPGPQPGAVQRGRGRRGGDDAARRGGRLCVSGAGMGAAAEILCRLRAGRLEGHLAAHREPGGSTSQDSYDRRSERGVSGLNQTHRFISNLVYALPGGKLKGVPGKLLGGGMSATNSTFAQGGGQRPNWTGKSARLENRTLAKWFDTSQFSQPAAQSNQPRIIQFALKLMM